MIGMETPFAKLMAAYCRRMGLQPAHVYFFTDDYEEIFHDDTAAMLGLVDGDVIFVDAAAVHSDDELAPEHSDDEFL